jgi:hypothetical protein
MADKREQFVVDVFGPGVERLISTLMGLAARAAFYLSFVEIAFSRSAKS